MPRKHTRQRIAGDQNHNLYRVGDEIHVGITPPGERQARWKNLGRVGLMEARTRRDEWAVEVRNAGPAPTAATTRLTFHEVSDLWLEEQRRLVAIDELQPRTYEAYECATRLHLVPQLGTRRVRTITSDHLVQWYADQRMTGAAPWSIKGRWTALRGILGYAARKQLVESNVADALTRRERPKTGESRKRILTDAEMQLLLKRTSPRHVPLVVVLLFAGLRLSEALGLVWRDVDFEAGVIRVRFQIDRQLQRKCLKTDAGARDVVMMDAVGKMLRRAKLAAPFSQDTDFVFATSTRTALSQRNATRRFLKGTGATAQRQAAKAGKPYEPCGLEDVTFHALRHTFASILIAQGRDVLFVSDQLGHEDPGFTLRTYAHLFRAAKQQREARDQLDAEYGAMLRSVGE